MLEGYSQVEKRKSSYTTSRMIGLHDHENVDRKDHDVREREGNDFFLWVEDRITSRASIRFS